MNFSCDIIEEVKAGVLKYSSEWEKYVFFIEGEVIRNYDQMIIL